MVSRSRFCDLGLTILGAAGFPVVGALFCVPIYSSSAGRPRCMTAGRRSCVCSTAQPILSACSAPYADDARSLIIASARGAVACCQEDLISSAPRSRSSSSASLPTETIQQTRLLRVSWYLDEHVVAAPEGDVTVPGHHVRFSIWFVDRPVCAMSLPEEEAIRLVDFLAGAAPLSVAPGRFTAQASKLA